MISHSHKCIFIHIPRTAGISIEKKFLSLLGLDYKDRLPLLLGPNKQPGIGPPRLAHLSLNELTKYHYISDEIAHNYFKFSFVRHPIDRLLSIYKYMNYIFLCSFDTFVAKALPRLIKSHWFFRSQTWFLENSEGFIDIDFIGRFESLAEDFEKVCNILKIKDTKLAHHNKSMTKLSYIRKTYRRFRLIKNDPKAIKLVSINFKTNKSKTEVSNESKKIIKRLYGRDFKTFNYL